MQIHELRKLDVEIAKLLGWKKIHRSTPVNSDLDYFGNDPALNSKAAGYWFAARPVPRYTTSLDDANILFATLCDEGHATTILRGGIYGKDKHWQVGAINWTTQEVVLFETELPAPTAATVPLAICLSYLKIYGAKPCVT